MRVATERGTTVLTTLKARSECFCFWKHPAGHTSSQSLFLLDKFPEFSAESLCLCQGMATTYSAKNAGILPP